MRLGSTPSGVSAKGRPVTCMGPLQQSLNFGGSMTEHFNNLDESELERLALLFEDCSEIIHIVGKIIRHGYQSTDPTKKVKERVTNRALLQNEIGQLQWTVQHMIKQGDLYEGSIEHTRDTRKEKVVKYLHHYSI